MAANMANSMSCEPIVLLISGPSVKPREGLVTGRKGLVTGPLGKKGPRCVHVV